MARTAAARTDLITFSGSLQTNGSYSRCGWVKSDHAPGNPASVFEDWFVCGNDPDFNVATFTWDHASAGFEASALHEDSTGSYTAHVHLGTLFANIWYHFGSVYDATAQTFKAYLNGALVGTVSAVAANSATAGTARVLSGCLGATAGECAHWAGQVLTDAEMLALARGVSPYRIRPSGLTVYVPAWGLHSPEIDLSASHRTGTVTGTTIASGPPVQPFSRKKSSFFIRPDGFLTRNYWWGNY